MDNDRDSPLGAWVCTLLGVLVLSLATYHVWDISQFNWPLDWRVCLYTGLILFEVLFGSLFAVAGLATFKRRRNRKMANDEFETNETVDD